MKNHIFDAEHLRWRIRSFVDFDAMSSMKITCSKGTTAAGTAKAGG